MTTLGRREPRFCDITRLRKTGGRYYAMAGLRKTVLVSEYSGGVMDLVGETVDLGCVARDVTSNGTDELYILTDEGLVVADLADDPEIINDDLAFDPGDGRWIVYTGSHIVAPLRRGIQVIDPDTLDATTAQVQGMDSCREAVLSSDDILYVLDEGRSKIRAFRIVGGTAQYINSFAAPNCRDSVKMELDEVNDLLFVVCKNRIISFDVSDTGAEDDEIDVSLHADYGRSTSEFTDFQVLPDGYWIGVNADTAMNPAARFQGRQFAVFDASLSDNGVLITAFPDVARYAVSNVVPYVAEEDIEDVVDDAEEVVPPVVTPDPPVITSSLVSSVQQSTSWSYTATASGTGPITFSATSLPIWATLNSATGAFSGMPVTPGVYNIQITATGPGGSDTETLVVTVTSVVASLAAVTVNAEVLKVLKVGNLAYIIGFFTSVTDANGTVTRNRGACLNLATGLWTSWNPNIGASPACIAADGAYIYLGGSFTTLNGAAHNRVGRVDATTGVRDATWLPVVAVGPTCFAFQGTDVLMGGNFTSVNGSGTYSRMVAVSKASSAVVTALDPASPAAVGASVLALYPSASGVVACTNLGIAASGPAYTWTSQGIHCVDPSGTPWRQSQGGANGTAFAANADASIVYCGFNATQISMFLQPAFNVNRTRGWAANMSTFSPTAWDPVASGTPLCLSVDAVHPGVFVGGSFASLGGDTSRRVLGKTDVTTGAILSPFLITFSDTVMDVNDVHADGGVLLIGGDWTGTVNGVSKSFFAVVDSRTGTLY